MKTLDDIPLTDRERQAIREAKQLLTERWPVEEVILFGSKARCDSGPESDIDLLVLGADTSVARQGGAMRSALVPVQLAHDVAFDILAESRDAWHNGVYQVLAIRREVERDGVTL
jgi:predicted nucleotidyltransferase